VLILSLKESDIQRRRRPAVVFLHSTNKYKEFLRPLLEVAYCIFSVSLIAEFVFLYSYEIGLMID
jgi:hypothetical protein